MPAAAGMLAAQDPPTRAGRLNYVSGTVSPRGLMSRLPDRHRRPRPKSAPLSLSPNSDVLLLSLRLHPRADRADRAAPPPRNPPERKQPEHH